MASSCLVSNKLQLRLTPAGWANEKHKGEPQNLGGPSKRNRQVAAMMIPAAISYVLSFFINVVVLAIPRDTMARKLALKQIEFLNTQIDSTIEKKHTDLFFVEIGLKKSPVKFSLKMLCSSKFCFSELAFSQAMLILGLKPSCITELPRPPHQLLY